MFEGLVPLSIDLLFDDPGHSHAHLEPFSPHRLEQDSQVHQSTTGDEKLLGTFPLLNPESDIAFQFLVESILQLP